MNEFALAVFSFVGGAGVVGGLILRRFDKIDRKLDKQEEARVDESIVIISGLRAIGHLSEATAMAQKRGHTNGETETALAYYQKSKDELNNYLLRRSAERTHGR
jgi:hypothetical protein